MPIIFFDNEPVNIDSMSNIPNCETVLIDHTIPNEFIRKNKKNSSYVQHFLEKGSTYAKLVQEQEGETIMPTTGITQEHISRLEKWIRRVNNPKIAVFDWDRTLIVVEGMLLPSSPYTYESYETTIEDALIYSIGGEQRFQQIKKMFEMLEENTVHVFILTNNNDANLKQALFLEIVRLIFPGVTKEKLICAYGFREKKAALESNQMYQNIIVSAGGGTAYKNKIRTKNQHIKRRRCKIAKTHKCKITPKLKSRKHKR
jgi:hypothetical protein